MIFGNWTFSIGASLASRCDIVDEYLKAIFTIRVKKRIVKTQIVSKYAVSVSDALTLDRLEN